MLIYPEIDPVALQLGPVKIHWYGLMYVIGFVAGWMTGRSTFASQVAYTWPVWVWLDGQLRFSTGNAFGARLDGLAANKLRLSGDIGVTSVGKRDQGFELLFGLGTETLEQGANITSVRLSIGSRTGF